MNSLLIRALLIESLIISYLVVSSYRDPILVDHICSPQTLSGADSLNFLTS